MDLGPQRFIWVVRSNIEYHLIRFKVVSVLGECEGIELTIGKPHKKIIHVVGSTVSLILLLQAPHHSIMYKFSFCPILNLLSLHFSDPNYGSTISRMIKMPRNLLDWMALNILCGLLLDPWWILILTFSYRALKMQGNFLRIHSPSQGNSRLMVGIHAWNWPFRQTINLLRCIMTL